MSNMNNPGRDTVNLPADDPCCCRRQPEVLRVVRGLAGFHPTRAAPEFERDEHWRNERLEAWRSGEFTLTANAIYQLGFQVAGAVGPNRIGGIDWNGESDYGSGPDPSEVPRWIETHQPHAFRRIAVRLPNPSPRVFS
jgi:hypothetical protein